MFMLCWWLNKNKKVDFFIVNTAYKFPLDKVIKELNF